MAPHEMLCNSEPDLHQLSKGLIKDCPDNQPGTETQSASIPGKQTQNLNISETSQHTMVWLPSCDHRQNLPMIRDDQRGETTL